MRKVHKVDANQKEIVDTLRQLGAGVLVLSGVGDGAPDIAAGFPGGCFDENALAVTLCQLSLCYYLRTIWMTHLCCQKTSI